jgi:hypothetical protein
VGDGGVNCVGDGVNVGNGAKVALSGPVCGAKHALKLINGVIKSAVMNIRISLRISNLHFPVPPPLTLRRSKSDHARLAPPPRAKVSVSLPGQPLAYARGTVMDEAADKD